MTDIFNQLADALRPPVFHQTTPLTATDLQQAVNDARLQSDRILLIFRTKAKPMTAWQVYDVYRTWFDNCLITSVRRSITDLTKAGRLTFTGQYVKERYKRPGGLWEINK